MTLDTTIQEIINDPKVQDFKPFILSNCHIPDLNWTLKEMNDHFYDWEAESILEGLSRMETLLSNNVTIAYDIYTKEEMAENPEKAKTKLFFFPGEEGKSFVLICPGGGYGAVCSMKEGFPVAARFNQAGYNAFILSYRVRSMHERAKGDALLPGPMEDMAHALHLIQDHQKEFHVTMEGYGVIGFSSGGHLAGEWATNNVGAENYGLPKPSVVVLGYSASDPTLYREFRGHNILCEGMFGKNYPSQLIHDYNINEHIDEDYPPTFVWLCRDDEIISYETSVRTREELEKHHVPLEFHLYDHGGHGFGLGLHTEAKDWINQAIRFFETHR